RSAALRSLLPTLALSGAWGWQVYRESEWDSIESWSVAAALSVPIFGGGQRHATLRQAGAARTAAELQLDSALRSAVQEVEAGLTSQAEQRSRAAAAAVQLQVARDAWQLALDQYRRGVADYLQVSNALATLLSAELSDIQARRDLLGARLQLHQALGGAWITDLDALSAPADGGAP
ncbi:MAG: TolC family protein, partial [Deltaproteobacteria bacterium]